jgi:Fe-coproporphyrin III synthase
LKLEKKANIAPYQFSIFGEPVPPCPVDGGAFDTGIECMMHLQSPLTVSWDVTMECHLKCKHCFNCSGPGQSQGQLDEREAQALCDQLLDMQVLNVCLCGGEPLLRKDLLDIARRLSRDDVVLSMVTNGYYLDRKKAFELADAGLRFVQVSIDGVNAEAHDHLRGVRGSFKRAVEAAHHVAETDIELAVAFCPTRFNIEQFGDYVDMVREIGARQIRMMPLLRMGREMLYREELMPTADQVVRFRQVVNQKTMECIDEGITVELGDPLEHMYLFPRNPAKLFILCIRSNGDLSITGYLPIIFGNIRQRPIMEYWNAGLSDVWRHPVVTQLCNQIQNLEDLHQLDPLPWMEGDLYVDLFSPARPLEELEKRSRMKPIGLKEGFKIRMEHGEVMSIFPLDDAARQVHFLNPNGTFIYRQCDGKNSVEQISEKLAEKHPDLDSESARHDVEECLASMARLGVVQWKNNGKVEKPRAGLVVRFAEEEDFERISEFYMKTLIQKRNGRGRDYWYLPVDVAGYFQPIAVRTRQFHGKELHYLLEQGGRILGLASLSFVAPPLTSAQLSSFVVRGRKREDDADLAGVLMDGMQRAALHLGMTKIKCGFTSKESKSSIYQFMLSQGFCKEARLENELGWGCHYDILSRMLKNGRGAK